MSIFSVARAVTYAALFIALIFIYLPGRLSWSGVVRPEANGASQIVGMIVGGGGTVIAFWCIFAFVFVGKGTPAPIDPPKQLVIRGPYRLCEIPCTLAPRSSSPAYRSSTNRFQSRCMLACSYSQHISSWSSTKNRLCGEPLDKNTRSTVPVLNGGGRRGTNRSLN